jgi:hypothetical protein
VPTYRVYYAAREPTSDDDALFPAARLGGMGIHRQDAYAETEWEETVEAGSTVEALDAFLRNRVRDNSELAWVDDDGEPHPVEGLDYNPELTYIWVEDGKLMEFQGIDEATPGMVTCPLCNGHGEVEEALAAEFEEVWGDEEDEIDADVKG